jgi:V8-like Glu-specific endopeptidase
MKLKVKDHLEALVAILLTSGFIFITIGAWNYMHPPLSARAAAHDKHKLSPVVRLTNPDGKTFCSGVVVSPHTVITAAHCVLEAIIFGMPLYHDGMQVRDTQADSPGIPVTVKYLSTQLDQATLDGDFSSFEPRNVITDIATLVEIAKQNTIFTSCGYPLGGNLYCSKYTYIGKINFMWLGKGELLPGMSGGPTMMDDGTVIAINDAVEDEFSIVTPVFNVPVDQ